MQTSTNILSSLGGPRTAWDDQVELNSPHGTKLKQVLSLAIQRALADEQSFILAANQAQQQAKLSELEVQEWLEKASKPEVRQTLSANANAGLNSIPNQIRQLLSKIADSVERMKDLIDQLVIYREHTPSIVNYVQITERNNIENAAIFQNVLDDVLPDLAPEERARLQNNFAEQQQNTVTIVEREARYLASHQQAANPEAPRPEFRRDHDVILNNVMQQEFFLLFRLKELLLLKAQKEDRALSGSQASMEAIRLLRPIFNRKNIKSKVDELSNTYQSQDTIQLVNEMQNGRADRGIMHTLDAVRQIQIEMTAQKHFVTQVVRQLEQMGIQVKAIGAEIVYNPGLVAARNNFSSPSAIQSPQPGAVRNKLEKEEEYNHRSPFVIPVPRPQGGSSSTPAA